MMPRTLVSEQDVLTYVTKSLDCVVVGWGGMCVSDLHGDQL